MSDIKKRVIYIIKEVLLYFPFLLLWCFVLVMASVGYSEGVLSVFEDAFGKCFVFIGWISAILAFSSIIYLRFFIKKEWLIHLVAYILTIIFIVCCLVFLRIGENKFHTFTTEKWKQYPARRITMYFDLVERYDIKGFSAQIIEELLGEPNSVSDNGTYIYEDNYDNAVYVKFEEGNALYIYYVE